MANIQVSETLRRRQETGDMDTTGRSPAAARGSSMLRIRLHGPRPRRIDALTLTGRGAGRLRRTGPGRRRAAVLLLE